MRKILPLIVLLFISAGMATQSCKKAKQIWDEIVNAYWQDTDKLTIKVEDDEAVVADPGFSWVGSNPSIFNPATDRYIINIVRTGDASWTGDVATPVKNGSGQVTSFDYRNEVITVTKDEDDNRTMQITQNGSSPRPWTQVEAPTPGGGGTGCDKIPAYEYQSEDSWYTLVNPVLGTFTSHNMKVKCWQDEHCRFSVWMLDPGQTGHNVTAVLYSKPDRTMTYNIQESLLLVRFENEGAATPGGMGSNADFVGGTLKCSTASGKVFLEGTDITFTTTAGTFKTSFKVEVK